MSLDRLSLADGWVDLAHGLVHRGGAPIPLTAKERELLAWLALHPDRGSREELQREIWGYAENIVSRTVDTTVRRLRMKIEADDARPAHLLTAHGTGYRWVAAGPAPAPIPLPRVAENEPLRGRSSELGRVAALLGARRPVTLIGPPGIGKSRLATAIAARDPRSVAWCDLTDVHTAHELAASVARVLGSELLDRDPIGQLGDLLAGIGASLLVLDGAERLRPDARAAAVAWHEHAEELAMLATSRRPLNLPGEAVVQLGPLDVDAAVALLEDRISASDAGHADPDALRRIAMRLEAHPLALELAAARLLVLTPSQLERRLARQLDLQDSRGRSLRAGLEEVWGELSTDQRRILEVTTVFRGGFTLEALEVVAPELDAVALLDALRERSLVRRLPDDPTRRRFAPYDAVRELALERSTASERAPLLDLHASWAVDYAVVLRDAHATDPSGCRAGMAAEYANLRAALDHLAATGDACRSAILAEAMDRYLASAGPFFERQQVIGCAAALADRAPPIEAAQILILRSDIAAFSGDYDQAAADLDEAARRGGHDPAIASRIAAFRGNLAFAQLRVTEAIALLSTAAEAEVAGERWGAAIRALNALGVACRHAGDLARAEDSYRRALAIGMQTGILHGEDTTLLNLATLASLRDRFDEARATFERLLERDLALSVRSAALSNLGYLSFAQGRPVEAERWLSSGLEAARQLGKTPRIARTRWGLALARWWNGDLSGAEAELRTAISEAARAGRADLGALARVELAAALAAQGRLPESEALWVGIEEHPWPNYAAARRAVLCAARALAHANSGRLDAARAALAEAEAPPPKLDVDMANVHAATVAPVLAAARRALDQDPLLPPDLTGRSRRSG